jgi:hypothetical protein
MRHLPYYHYQRDRNGLLERETFLSSLQAYIDGQAYTDDTRVPSCRHGGTCGSNGMLIDTSHQCRFLGQWPRGCANLVANIIGQERQFGNRIPSSSYRLSANVLQLKLMIHTNLNFGFHDFEHQPTPRSRIVLILTRNSTRPAVTGTTYMPG